FAGVLFSAAAAGPATSANRAINANSTEQSFVVRLVCFIFYFLSLIGPSVNWEQRIVFPLTLFAHVRLLLVAGGFRRVLQTLQRVVERKTARLLARRKFLERGQELPDIRSEERRVG